MKATKQKFNPSKLNHSNIKIIVVLLTVLLVLLSFATLRNTDTLITHDQANTLYTEGKIQKVIIDGDFLRLKTDTLTYKIYKDAINKTAFFTKYPVEVREDNSYLYDLLSLLIIIAAFGFLYRLMKQNRLQQLKYIRASSKEDDTPGNEPVQALTSNVTFADVAGIKDVKEELEEIIDFLKEPQKYRDLDIRLPKGVLLVGPPGVGKTLISKAVAGEANVPFFYQSGASFVHIYVGMGAKRVSELFKKAKQMAPSIVFIDEIDAVGKSRGEFRNDEREATLNQLLTEMDGFEDSSGVIVIGATNKIEMLDEALLRAGRFDRRIHISLPDLEDRAKTLELYLAHKPNEVDIKLVARMTVGFNSAALDTLTNEAAIFAMREGRSIVETSDFEAVKEKVLLGKRKILSFTEEEREIQAIYQAAKAVIATWLDVEFEKIGIVNTRLLSQEHEILSRSQLLSRIKVYLAGSIATKIHFNEQFTNASTDIAQAKEIVRKVIYEYVMSENFIVTHQQEEELLRESVSEVTTLLKTLDKALSEVSIYLLAHENITAEECRVILRKIF
ncbi:MAG: ATP-dependent metallopeptidase FtsH/Yme1/Tma family protein [Sulfurovum sp.]|uniref:ATP-dependent metallopeptidase FtsH/Yme1/Tma family protein n=1 Tax=Sulfurovum sp. TaxID=1969726 RepID=UPI002867D06C|nr:ATP-dependent metallopeptidase FtsH/Yme1/Tma family protein [Sulfurovum sp.]MCO4845442.1 ATP-dependent metallopeptidase FtsH/Yme1/Tma family protein [Sulfurovum sp.]